MLESRSDGRFPTASGILFGFGFGGFFDGIVLHQLLQWHHMVSSWYPPTTLENLRLNTLWDGIFHSATYLFLLFAVYLFWKVAHKQHVYWSPRLITGSALLGWGCFNVLEGVIDHQILGVHHVNEQVPASDLMMWDMAFLAWGASMVIGGWLLFRSGRQRQAGAAMSSDVAKTQI